MHSAAFDDKSIRYLTSVALVNVVGAFQQITGTSYNRCFRLESKRKSYNVYLTSRHKLESEQGLIFRLDNHTNKAGYINTLNCILIFFAGNCGNHKKLYSKELTYLNCGFAIQTCQLFRIAATVCKKQLI